MQPRLSSIKWDVQMIMNSEITGTWEEDGTAYYNHSLRIIEQFLEYLINQPRFKQVPPN